MFRQGQPKMPPMTGGHWTTSHICNRSCKLLLSQQPRTQKKEQLLIALLFFFGARCETWTHTVSHTPLKRARLPIPPISHCLYIIVDCLPFVKCFSQIYRQKSSFFSSSVTRFHLPISFVNRGGTPLCKRKNAILTFVSLRLYKWWRRKARKEWKN